MVVWAGSVCVMETVIEASVLIIPSVWVSEAADVLAMVVDTDAASL
jgi:hypothetical protein